MRFAVKNKLGKQNFTVVIFFWNSLNDIFMRTELKGLGNVQNSWKASTASKGKKKGEKNQNISGEETGKARSSRRSNCASGGSHTKDDLVAQQCRDLVPRLIIQLEEWRGNVTKNFQQDACVHAVIFYICRIQIIRCLLAQRKASKSSQITGPHLMIAICHQKIFPVLKSLKWAQQCP